MFGTYIKWGIVFKILNLFYRKTKKIWVMGGVLHGLGWAMTHPEKLKT